MGIADMLDELEIKEPLPSYSPTLYRITGGKGEAVALAQLIYKCSKSNWGTARLNLTDWENEIQLSRREFDNLNNCIVELELGNIDLCYVGPVKKMAYTLSKEAVYNALKDTSVIYGTRNKLRRSVKEVAEVNKTSVKWQGNKVRRSLKEDAHIKEYKNNKSKEDKKDYSLADEKSAQTNQPIQPDLFGEVIEKKATTKSPKVPKEKAPPAPPKHLHFIQFRESYLRWYKDKFGVAHTFKDKEAGMLSNLIDRLKQVTETDEATALLTFQAMLTNWDGLGKYNRGKPQLNLILANLNSICTELKEANEIELHSQRWGRGI